jgi:hypothetical protein
VAAAGKKASIGHLASKQRRRTQQQQKEEKKSKGN